MSRNLKRELLNAEDEVRQRIGQDIHDGLQQEIAGLSLLAQGLFDRFMKETAPLDDQSLSHCRALAEKIVRGFAHALQEIQVLAQGSTPADLSDGNLSEALRALIRRIDGANGIACRFDQDFPIEVRDLEAANQLYRIVQEALMNALKHACASRILVSTRLQDGKLVLRVIDDGKGFPGTHRFEGIGLRNMRYRAELIGADLRVDSSRENGTAVTCIVDPAGNGAMHLPKKDLPSFHDFRPSITPESNGSQRLIANESPNGTKPKQS